ncbi:cation diffusion facilitator family transporter [Geomonas oryzisoli]|uniref:Cation diffusion facilitator family transporter n=1 Tax=Geomonas oryzisoli TaxID=2847992 RepID=A0ABX8J8C9_9BACT|nr:cation diffusion facilitator family transporter [Geomonas oryzisoli]QWV92967.1 cation diffusion facilitator family transporter [Geomonas oryzisoli]
MSGSPKKVIWAAMAANLAIAAIKFFAAWRTGSSAILSEGIHSVVDTSDQVLLLYGLHRAALPPDRDFPFGHGKEIYFWSFVVAMLIFSLGAGVSFYEGVHHLLHPAKLVDPKVNYFVIAAAMIFEGISWTISVLEFRKQKKPGLGYLQAIHRGKDPTLFLVLMEDSAALLGLLTALIGIGLSQATGHHFFDGAASLVIGAILAATAVFLARETKGLLIGEAADREAEQVIRGIVQKGQHVERVNEVLTLQMGPEYVLATVALAFADGITADQIEDEVAKLETEIKKSLPTVKKVYIEAEGEKTV